MSLNKRYKNTNSYFKIEPRYRKPSKLKFNLEGFIGGRLKANEEEWLLKAIDANPAIINIFHQRDLKPSLNIDVHSGEYPGKFLTGAVLCWNISHSNYLKIVIEKLIKEISIAQDSNGYLGPFSQKQRFFGKIKKFIQSDWVDLFMFQEGSSGIHRLLREIRKTPIYESNVWDLWGHYHCMLGLWLWYCETGDKLAFKICIKAADLICDIFLDSKKNVYNTGAYECNMAIIHIFCLLYKRIGNPKYIKMVHKIENEWNTEGAGAYLNSAIEKKEFYEITKPRWESLHNIQALSELYYITGDQKYKEAFEHFYWSIVKYDRHNTGGFSSGEQARGNPYDPRVIETCATVAWIALSVDMLRLTGDSVVADELELSTFNAMLGAQSPSGRWWSYNTPMDGLRKAFYHDVNWQCLPGGPELNCCYMSGAKGLGMLSEWAFMISSDGIYINYYGPGAFKLMSPSTQYITLVQKTDYPKKGEISICINLNKSERFTLRLRIPKWSCKSNVMVNGKKEKNVMSGNYYSIDKIWKKGDLIKLSLDMSFHFWKGRKECSGKTSIYYGPILLAYDRYFNKTITDDIQIISLDRYKKIEIKKRHKLSPWILFKFAENDGKDVILCDFATAGVNGSSYKTWLSIADFYDTSFFDPVNY